jgi:hypothetical protein
MAPHRVSVLSTSQDTRAGPEPRMTAKPSGQARQGLAIAQCGERAGWRSRSRALIQRIVILPLATRLADRLRDCRRVPLLRGLAGMCRP